MPWDVAADGEEGLVMALTRVHDLIILDIRLPRMDGLRVLQALRQDDVTAPVLLLTVRATIEDKVLGLDAGADDYLTKPFAFQELVARVRALLRRRAEGEPTVLHIGDLTLRSRPANRHAGRRKDRFDPARIRSPRLFHAQPWPRTHRTMIADMYGITL